MMLIVLINLFEYKYREFFEKMQTKWYIARVRGARWTEKDWERLRRAEKGWVARQRDCGTAGLRDNGTAELRDFGTTGQRDNGTARLRDNGTR